MEHPHFYHWYCQHVIPLVFDNSLSYYEVLCKLTQAMGELTKKQEEYFETLKPIIDSIDNIINVAWPNFQQEINDKVESWNTQFNELETNVTNKLEEYKQNYESFTSHWNEALSGNQAAINQMKADIAAMDAELKDRLQDQDNNISESLQRHLGLINNAIAAQDKKIQDFIDTYNPVPVPQPMYPEAIVTTAPEATVTAVNGDKSVTAIAGSDGLSKLVLKGYGNWVLTATLNGLTGEPVALLVDDVKQYQLTVNPGTAPSKFYIHINATFPNNSPLRAVFEQGIFKLTGPGGSSEQASATPTHTFTVNEPGNYTFEYMPANTIPHLDASSGFSITSNEKRWTTVLTRTETLSNTVTDVTINFSVPTISIGWKTGNPMMNITPPVITERKTGITASTNPYIFIPWAKGQWLFDNNNGFDKGYTVKETDGLNFSFDLIKCRVDNAPTSEYSRIPYSNVLGQLSPATETDLSNNAHSVINGLKLATGACANNGELVGYIFTKTGDNYIYEDGTDYLSTHYAGLIIPAIDYGYRFTASTGLPSEIGGLFARPTSTETSGLYAFSPVHSMDNAWHDGILVSYAPYDPNTDSFNPGYKPNGTHPSLNQNNIFYPGSYSLPPNCELMRIDQAIFLHIVRLAMAGGKNWGLSFPADDMTNYYRVGNSINFSYSFFGFSTVTFNVVTSTASGRTFIAPTSGGTQTWANWSSNRFDRSAELESIQQPFPRMSYPNSTSPVAPKGPVEFRSKTTKVSPAVMANNAAAPITVTNETPGTCNPVFFLNND